MDNIKNKLITAMVFTAEDTGGLIIHLNGFEDEKHANKFLKRLMKNSGIDYKSVRELFDLPTIHQEGTWNYLYMKLNTTGEITKEWLQVLQL